MMHARSALSSLAVPLLVVAGIVAACDGCKSDGARTDTPKDAGAAKEAPKDEPRPDAGAAVGDAPPGPVLEGPTRPARAPGALDPLLDEAARLAKAASTDKAPTDAELSAFVASVKAIVDKAGVAAKRTDLAAPPAVTARAAAGAGEVAEAVAFVRDAVVQKVERGVLVAEGSVSVAEASHAVIIASDVAFVGSCVSCIVIAGGRVDVGSATSAPVKKGAKGKPAASVVLSGGELSLADAGDALVGSGDATTIAKEGADVAKLDAAAGLVLASRRTLAPIEADVSSTTPAEGEAVVRAKGGRSGRKTLRGQPPMTRKGPIPGTEGWILVQVTDKIAAFRNRDAFAIVPVVPLDRSQPFAGQKKRGGGEE